jgi:mxaL protein
MFAELPKPLKDYRLWCVALALTAVLFSQIKPTEVEQVPVYRMIAIVDITRSMNAEDYELDGKPVSRLEYVKNSLRELLLQLPCQSKLGLGIFTDRRSTLLLEPIEVCSGFNELNQSIAALDWRMAWAADSRIASGLLATMEMLQQRDESLLFLTDGQEAPPVNPLYQPDFSAMKGKLKGMVVGVGGIQPVPIPKFSNRGEREGVYTAEDVPHRSTFGESDLNPEKIEGYNARNAPFGSAEVIGSEHLSALNEVYLRQLETESGLIYHRLIDTNTLVDDLHESVQAVHSQASIDTRWRFVLLALLLTVICWLSVGWHR